MFQKTIRNYCSVRIKKTFIFLFSIKKSIAIVIDIKILFIFIVMLKIRCLLFFCFFIICKVSKSQTVTDTCRTDLYYQKISKNNFDLEIVKSRTLNNNDVVGIGSIKGTVNKDGIVIRKDKNGNLIWQKSYGNPNADEAFTSFREYENEDMFIVGTSEDRISHKVTMIALRISAQGNIIWQHAYVTLGNVFSPKISRSLYSDFSFAATSDSSMIYGMMNQVTGNLVWQKSVKTNTGARVIEITDDAGSILILTSCIDSTFHTVNQYYIPYYQNGKKTITYTRKLGGFHQNAHYYIHDADEISLYSYFTGIRSVGGAPWELIRVNVKAYIQVALEKIFTPNVIIDSSALTAMSSDGGCVAFSPTLKSKQIYIVTLSGSEDLQTYKYWSSVYTLPDSVQLNGCVKTWDQGYTIYSSGKTSSNNKNLIQLKTDSAGSNPSCVEKAPTDWSILRVPFPTDTVTYFYVSDTLLNGFGTISNISFSVDSTNVCRELKCPLIPTTEICYNSFYKKYRGFNSTYPINLLSMGGSLYQSGIAYDQPYHSLREGSFISKISANGQILKQKIFIADKRSPYAKMVKSNDSALLFFGSCVDTNFVYSYILQKIDSNLNNVWIKSFRILNFYPGGQVSISDIKQAADGSIFLLLHDDKVFTEKRTFLVKTDANGNFLWSKIFRPQYTAEFNNIVAKTLCLNGSDVYIVCINAYNDYAASILIKASQVNGNMSWCKIYSNTYEHVNLSNMMNCYNGELYFGGRVKGQASASHNILLKTDLNGNVLAQKSLSILGSPLGSNWLTYQSPNGSITMSSSNYNGNNSWMDFNLQMNENFIIKYAKSRGSSFTKFNRALVTGPDNSIYETGSIQPAFFVPYSSSTSFLIKYSNEGKIGVCLSDSLMLKDTIIQININPIPCIVSDTTMFFSTVPTISRQQYNAESELICASVPGCSSVNILGQDTICDMQQEYIFTAQKNIGCNAPLEWITDPLNMQITYISGNTIRIKFIGGNTKLKVRIVSNCIPIIDSINIQVYSPVTVLNLGNDTSVCAGNIITLNAHKGYKNYLWQNGTTDSLLTVTTSGTYYVQVTDSCNNIFRDTINIHFFGNGNLLNLGPDRGICLGSSILLNARSGFKSYLWQNGTTDSLLLISTPGLYYVTVIDSCDQIMKDSILIHSYKIAASLNLGIDTALCNAQSVLLNAHVGFSSYIWQNGSVDSIFNATTAGLYYVTVIDSCGISFTDSIHIYDDANVLFDLGPNLAKCNTDTLTLSINSGYNNYQWYPSINMIVQSNTSVKVFPNNAIKYYVNAKKTNGCNVSDSIQIIVNHSAPINLGNDLRLCSGDSTKLNAGQGFLQYFWSTGQNAPSIYAQNPNTYFVAAIDFNTCISRDTIVILSPYPLPLVQIMGDTSICNGGNKTLDAGNGYLSYFWNTGSHQQSIIVNSVGKYWVNITDQRGCKTSDTVSIVSKNCSQYILFPNSFSPNGDGLNDVFKANFSEIPVEYNLSVYNRYGQLIFETIDIKGGWKGTYKGILQNLGAFVYQCSYRFVNNKSQFIQGTVLLIK